jgi:transposase
MEVDLARLTYEDELLRALALSIVNTATKHDAHPLSLLHTAPGIGKLLRLGLLYAIHRLDRFPRVPECPSSCRLVHCRKESGGTRVGTSGNKIGPAHLHWAFSAAATRFLRNHEPGQN